MLEIWIGNNNYVEKASKKTQSVLENPIQIKVSTVSQRNGIIKALSNYGDKQK